MKNFPGCLVAKSQDPNAGVLSSIPGQGTRSHMPHLSVSMQQVKILHSATKTWHCQINEWNKEIFLKTFNKISFTTILAEIQKSDKHKDVEKSHAYSYWFVNL